MFKFEMEGMDKLQKQLKDMERAAKSLEKGESVQFDDLFNQVFMEKYTQFSSFDDFLKAGGFVVESQEEFEAIPDQDMNDHVSKTTNFRSWEEMFHAAGEKYFIKRLGL